MTLRDRHDLHLWAAVAFWLAVILVSGLCYGPVPPTAIW